VQKSATHQPTPQSSIGFQGYHHYLKKEEAYAVRININHMA
jgi:hypothetical protein